ncbi:MAG TPA: hypothetical protein VGN95_20845 [Pyrinomonadaceae bacterium]|jgi:hypothetical protein|nr:hypothetical protein [Pyrinomonadaceae bacterium]
MSRKQSEQEALAQLQRAKASYQSFIKLNYEHAAEDCRTCPTRGVCCMDAHFVNVHITRLEAVAIRETLARTPRLSDAGRRAVYARAVEAVKRYNLSAAGDTFKQTYSCPLYESSVGCLVHARAKPAPCIQHACYENWEDLPPASLQARTEHRVEQLNEEVYGAEWGWLPVPVWLTLVDPESDGAELERLMRQWSARRTKSEGNSAHQAQQGTGRKRASLPVIHTRG